MSFYASSIAITPKEHLSALGLKDAEAIGGDQWEQKETNITRANASTFCL